MFILFWNYYAGNVIEFSERADLIAGSVHSEEGREGRWLNIWRANSSSCRRIGRRRLPKLIRRAVQDLNRQSGLWLKAINPEPSEETRKCSSRSTLFFFLKFFWLIIGFNIMADCNVSIDQNKLPGVKEGNVFTWDVYLLFGDTSEANI